MQFFAKKFRGWANVADVFLSLCGDEPNAFWLDREHHFSDKYSVIGAGELERFASIAALRERLDQLAQTWPASDMKADLPFDFRPGLVGEVDYEAQDLRFILAERAIVFDHANRGMYFLGWFASEADFLHWHHAAMLRLALIGGQEAAYRHRSTRTGVVGVAHPRLTDSLYLENIAEAKRLIAEGDVYQICLTNRLEFEHDIDPALVFIRLRATNPAPYSCFLRLGQTSLVCASPEQFLTVDGDGLMTSKPIKGTRSRSQDPAEDLELAAELRSNPKERAENLMIVDLMRNDLASVAEPDSVAVPQLFAVESYATVHQLVSTVTAKLRSGLAAVDALEAVFPGGSMTGAPKLRAMTHIARLERGLRGIYSGAVGFISTFGTADFGMVIRSIVLESDRGYLGVGGGITIDSDAESELAEVKLKARASLEALGTECAW